MEKPKDESTFMIKGKPAKYNRAYYQFKALRNAWSKSKSEMKDVMVQMLTESMREVVELYNLEQDVLKDLQDWKE